MEELELVLGLLVAVVMLTIAAPLLRIPAPILLVLGGLVMALLPQIPDVVLAPDVVFLLFLPPLLYSAAFDTSIRDIRAHLQPIVSLAVGLVLATTVVVAVVVQALVPGLGWPLAFAFGAIVSPTDAVAAAAVFRELGVPRRLVTLLEGESLFNDATALVTYRAALAAAATATFSPGDASLRFLIVGLGGLLLGVAIGWLVAHLERRLYDPAIEIAVSLLTPYGAYLLAENVGVSGVLATVAAGLCAGWWSPVLLEPDTRLRSRAVWDMFIYLLNGLVFILIGLQLLRLLPALRIRSFDTLIGLGLIVSVSAIVVRFAWVFGADGLSRLLSRRPTASAFTPREEVVVSWAGMRGVVSLATALALPLETPDRDLLIFLTFCVILVTLVGQGLSLPWLLRNLGISADDVGGDERRARRVATEAALERLDELDVEWPNHRSLIESLRAHYTHRANDLDQEPEKSSDPAIDDELLEHRQIRQSVLAAERAAVLDLRARGALDDQTWRHIQRDLDLEAVRLDS